MNIRTTENRDEAGRYHGLLHGDDLLAVDLPQSASMAFQSHLQTTSGLKHTHVKTFYTPINLILIEFRFNNMFGGELMFFFPACFKTRNS